MSDIGFYGIAAALTILVMGGLAILVVVISGASLWLFRRKRMKGFLQSGLFLFVFSALSLWWIEDVHNLEVLRWLDDYSFFISFLLLGCCGWYGIRYFKQAEN